MWCDVVWCGVVWCDVVWCNFVCCDVGCDVVELFGGWWLDDVVWFGTLMRWCVDVWGSDVMVRCWNYWGSCIYSVKHTCCNYPQNCPSTLESTERCSLQLQRPLLPPLPPPPKPPSPPQPLQTTTLLQEPPLAPIPDILQSFFFFHYFIEEIFIFLEYSKLLFISIPQMEILEVHFVKFLTDIITLPISRNQLGSSILMLSSLSKFVSSSCPISFVFSFSFHLYSCTTTTTRLNTPFRPAPPLQNAISVAVKHVSPIDWCSRHTHIRLFPPIHPLHIIQQSCIVHGESHNYCEELIKISKCSLA